MQIQFFVQCYQPRPIIVNCRYRYRYCYSHYPQLKKKNSICLQWLNISFVLQSFPHRVSALVGLNISATKDLKAICTGYVKKSTAPRKAGSPGQQNTNGVNSLRVCTTEQYVFLAGFTGQIHPSADAEKAVLKLLGILSSLWTFKMRLQMPNV